MYGMNVKGKTMHTHSAQAICLQTNSPPYFNARLWDMIFNG